MATAAPFVKLLRQLSTAKDEYRSGALDITWDGTKATLFFVFGQPNHATYETDGKEPLQGQEALAALLHTLPRKFTLAPWRKAVVRDETLRMTVDELMEPFAQLAGTATSGAEEAPARTAVADAADMGTGFDADFEFNFETFPLLPVGEPLWSDAAVNVVHLDLLIPKLPTALIVVTSPTVRAAALTLSGRLIDAVWIDDHERLAGEGAATALIAATEGTVSCYRLDDPKLAEALTMLWRCPVRQRDIDTSWLDPTSFLQGIANEKRDCVLTVKGATSAVACFMGGDLVAVYTSDDRTPSHDLDVLANALRQSGATMTLQERARDQVATIGTGEGGYHATGDTPSYAAMGSDLATESAAEPEAETPAAASDLASTPDTAAAAAPSDATAEAAAPEAATDDTTEDATASWDAATAATPDTWGGGFDAAPAVNEAATTEAATADDEATLEAADAATPDPAAAPADDDATGLGASDDPSSSWTTPSTSGFETWQPSSATPTETAWGTTPAAETDDTAASSWGATPAAETDDTTSQWGTMMPADDATDDAAASPWGAIPPADGATDAAPAWGTRDADPPATTTGADDDATSATTSDDAPAASAPAWGADPADEVVEDDATDDDGADIAASFFGMGADPEYVDDPLSDAEMPTANGSGSAEAPTWFIPEPGASGTADALSPSAEPADDPAPAPASSDASGPPTDGIDDPSASPFFFGVDAPEGDATGAEPTPADAYASSTTLELDFDSIKQDLIQIGVLWLGSDDVAPVAELIRETKPSVDDFVATIDAIKAITVVGHDPSVIRAMAREMHYHAAEYLSGA